MGSSSQINMSTTKEDEIASQIISELASTEYACSSLARLSGGTVNFLFKGTLQKPLEDGTAEVVVKHGEGFSASWADLKLSQRRCVSPTNEPFPLGLGPSADKGGHLGHREGVSRGRRVSASDLEPALQRQDAASAPLGSRLEHAGPGISAQLSRPQEICTETLHGIDPGV